MLEAVLRASGLVGTFDKPRYINFAPELCAHSRSRIVGCHRCLDLCPTGAIIRMASMSRSILISAPAAANAPQYVRPVQRLTHSRRDHVALPYARLLITYRQAGGQTPIILIHDSSHGADLLAALDRFGPEIPAHILAVEVNEVTEIGIEAIAAAFSWGQPALHFSQGAVHVMEWKGWAGL